MRRRQEWAKNPPAFVPTEPKPLNESVLPVEAPRRRAVYVDENEVSMHWDRAATCEEQASSETPVKELSEAPPESKRRPGRPRKDKQAA